MLEENSDADLVIFLSCFSSYQDQAEKRGSMIETIEQNLNRCRYSIAFQVDIQSPKSKGSPPRSLALTIQSRKKKEAVEVDILPAYDVLGRRSMLSQHDPPCLVGLMGILSLPLWRGQTFLTAGSTKGARAKDDYNFYSFSISQDR